MAGFPISTPYFGQRPQVDPWTGWPIAASPVPVFAGQLPPVNRAASGGGGASQPAPVVEDVASGPNDRPLTRLLAKLRDRRQARGKETGFLDAWLNAGGAGSGFLREKYAELGQNIDSGQRPFLQALRDNSNAIMLAGSGMRQGPGGFGQGFAQGAQIDQQNADYRRQLAAYEQQQQAQQALFANAPPLIGQAVAAGMPGVGEQWVMNEAFPQTPEADWQRVTLAGGPNGEPGNWEYFVDPNNPGMRQAIGPAEEKGPLVENNIGAQETALQQKLGSEVGTLFAGMITDGVQAQTDLSLVNRLGDLLQQTGPGGVVTGFQAAASNLGIALGENVDEIQAAQAIISYLTPRQRVPGSGTTSDFDARMFAESLPRLINQPGGNELIIGTMQGLAQLRVAQGNIAIRLANGEIDQAEAFRLLGELPDPFAAARAAGVVPPAGADQANAAAYPPGAPEGARIAADPQGNLFYDAGDTWEPVPQEWYQQGVPTQPTAPVLPQGDWNWRPTLPYNFNARQQFNAPLIRPPGFQ